MINFKKTVISIFACAALIISVLGASTTGASAGWVNDHDQNQQINRGYEIDFDFDDDDDDDDDDDGQCH